MLGDTAYNSVGSVELDRMIELINREQNLSFVLHAGDIKGLAPACTDVLLQEKFDQLQQFDLPFIYTPGDNEWTDCHTSSGGNFDPVDRLAELRKIFYPDPDFTTGGKRMRVRSQSSDPLFSKFVENVLWVKKGVVFGTIHVVGSNNGLDPWTGFYPSDTFENPQPERLEEFETRLAATIAWLDEIFAVATESESRAVFVMMQANPRFDRQPDDQARAGVNDIIDHLRMRTLQYEKPVVLAHGDLHRLIIDNPMFADVVGGGRRRVLNLTRVQTVGSPDVQWLRITVNHNKAGVFSFTPVVVEGNVPDFELPAEFVVP